LGSSFAQAQPPAHLVHPKLKGRRLGSDCHLNRFVLKLFVFEAKAKFQLVFNFAKTGKEADGCFFKLFLVLEDGLVDGAGATEPRLRKGGLLQLSADWLGEDRAWLVSVLELLRCKLDYGM
jgi:hypothetical protein